MRRYTLGTLLSLIAFLCAVSAHAQEASDRVDAVLSGAPTEVRARKDEPDKQMVVGEEINAPRLDTESGLFVGAIVITGLSEMTNADFAPVIDKYVGHVLDNAALIKLATEISAVAKSKGFIFANATIAPQSLSHGVLQVQLDEGRLDEVRLTGQAHSAVKRLLEKLISARPVRLSELERQLLLADDLPGIRLGDATLLVEGGRKILQIPVQIDRIEGRAYFSNDGSEAFGRHNVRLAVDLNGLLDDNDVTSAYVSTTPFQPGEFAYGRLDYGREIGASGMSVSVFTSASRSRPGGYLAARSLRGTSEQLGVAGAYPLLRRRALSLWLEGNLKLQESRQRSAGLLVRSDRTTTTNIGLTGFAKGEFGRVRFNAQLTQGIDALGATASNDPLNSRADAGPVFTSLRISTDWTHQVSRPLSIFIAAQGQIALGPLPSSEEFSLGGSRFLRAYDYSEVRGDRGFAVSNEIRYDFEGDGAISSAQFYGFADAGVVDDLGSLSDSSRLASSGAGIRIDVNKMFDANLEVAIPLTGPRFESGSANPRVSIGVAKHF
ncbi:ShlB/FhaC/HecB family hemolysin secretion/activation protein [Sphingorhabdus soli]|uniref:ShlB/FhaC/HecB family hemolysin secretion/activation protein n=1 Tax=Flavisphingopyxis soli TaxID=2601267 RepID=A0A5C6UB57_9SPHN|nr:ShlB/FhaC/HecB family hemolysin secretion/activation protein [Sphingorhabdus soli]TXC69266.1 ShlB/FhaC/HecB family hemolysin secretion/activation protein [Sphingorhabdus soli]